MSFANAIALLRLAEIAGARHGGVTLSEIEETFEVNRRTAQRMTKALEESFPCTVTTDPERRKRWKIPATDMRTILSQGVREAELTALDMAIRRAENDGATTEVEALTRLRDRLLAAMPSSHARRVEADAEALLEAYGFASRPGPRARAAPALLGTIAEALKGPQRLTIAYRGAADAEPSTRLVEPHGLLLGTRRYLVARPADGGGQGRHGGGDCQGRRGGGDGHGRHGGGDGRMRHYRLDRIAEARLEPDSFPRDPEFDLARHAARAFGSFHAEKEYGEVVWRFSPDAAPTARAFLFHPDQQMIDEADGALTIRFHASGWLEMAWHLYMWGDAVEVVEPGELRDMVAGYRRGDFPALP